MTANSNYAEIKWQGPGESEERDISWFAWSFARDVSSDGHTVLFTRVDEGAGLDYQMGLRRIDAAGAVLLGTGQDSSVARWEVGAWPHVQHTQSLRCRLARASGEP